MNRIVQQLEMIFKGLVFAILLLLSSAEFPRNHFKTAIDDAVKTIVLRSDSCSSNGQKELTSCLSALLPGEPEIFQNVENAIMDIVYHFPENECDMTSENRSTEVENELIDYRYQIYKLVQANGDAGLVRRKIGQFFGTLICAIETNIDLGEIKNNFHIPDGTPCLHDIIVKNMVDMASCAERTDLAIVVEKVNLIENKFLPVMGVCNPTTGFTFMCTTTNFWNAVEPKLRELKFQICPHDKLHFQDGRMKIQEFESIGDFISDSTKCGTNTKNERYEGYEHGLIQMASTLQMGSELYLFVEKHEFLEFTASSIGGRNETFQIFSSLILSKKIRLHIIFGEDRNFIDTKTWRFFNLAKRSGGLFLTTKHFSLEVPEKSKDFNFARFDQRVYDRIVDEKSGVQTVQLGPQSENLLLVFCKHAFSSTGPPYFEFKEMDKIPKELCREEKEGEHDLCYNISGKTSERIKFKIDETTSCYVQIQRIDQNNRFSTMMLRKSKDTQSFQMLDNSPIATDTLRLETIPSKNITCSLIPLNSNMKEQKIDCTFNMTSVKQTDFTFLEIRIGKEGQYVYPNMLYPKLASNQTVTFQNQKSKDPIDPRFSSPTETEFVCTNEAPKNETAAMELFSDSFRVDFQKFSVMENKERHSSRRVSVSEVSVSGANNSIIQWYAWYPLVLLESFKNYHTKLFLKPTNDKLVTMDCSSLNAENCKEHPFKEIVEFNLRINYIAAYSNPPGEKIVIKEADGFSKKFEVSGSCCIKEATVFAATKFGVTARVDVTMGAGQIAPYFAIIILAYVFSYYF